MIVYLLIIVLLAGLALGMPIVFALGIPGVLYLLIQGTPLVMIPSKMFTGVDVYVLLALPMFILAGNLMNSSGISRRLVRFSLALVGSLPGGLGMVNVVASMFFAGVTGAAMADTAAMGSILIPAMHEEGYEDGFSAAITAVSSTVGPIIPPSILFVVYGYIANVSIGSLFLAGFIPGILIGLSLMVAVYIVSRKRNYPRGPRFSPRVLIREFRSSLIALIFPVLIVAGMVFGVMTPTEVSAMAVVLAFITGKFIYKELKWSDMGKIFIQSGILSGSVVFIVATNNILLYAVTLEQIADKIGAAFFSITQNKVLLLLMLNFVLLFFGALIDTLPLMIMFIPVLLPLFAKLGVHPIHAGVFVVLNMVIGISTPPVGPGLFIATSIAKVDLLTAARAMVPFLIAVIAVLLLVTYCPPITLWIPSLVMK